MTVSPDQIQTTHAIASACFGIAGAAAVSRKAIVTGIFVFMGAWILTAVI